MPLAKKLKRGLLSTWFSTSPSPAEKEEPVVAITVDDSPKNPQLLLWESALQAAQLRENHPSPADALIPWSRGIRSADVCTLTPAPDSGRLTLFLRTTMPAYELAVRLNTDFFSQLELIVKAPEVDGNGISKAKKDEQPIAPKTVKLESKGGNVILNIETALGKNIYGDILTLTCTVVDIQKTLQYLESIFPTGFACIVPHDLVATTIDTVKGPMKLIKRTGVDKDTSSAEHLTTIFELEVEDAPPFDNPEGLEPHGVGDKIVARCVMGYRDASFWPSVGPTIQSLAVRRDYHGTGLVQDLFNAVEGWFVRYWNLDTVQRNRIFKVTQLKDFIVDRASGGDSAQPDEDQALTDKIFFYEVMNFVCNMAQPDDPRSELAVGTAPENHGIKYYPAAGTVVPVPTVFYSNSYTSRGWRSCENCKVVEEAPSSSLQVCSRCDLPVYWRAHYCSRQCQKEDWAFHKLSCGKTYDEVCAGKKAFEESLTALSS